MKNILVIRFSSLGDVVLTTGVLRYIKTIKPDVNIHVITADRFKDVFEGLPFITMVYGLNRGKGLRELPDIIRSMPDFDAVIDLHDNLRSLILKFLLGVTSFTYVKNSMARRLFVKFRLCSKYLTNHTVEKYFEPFARIFNLKLPDIERLRPCLSQQEVAKKPVKTVVIHPFASKKCKEWVYFYELCEKFINNGIKVVVIGEGAINLPPQVDDKTGFVPLEILKENISGCDLFLSTDSGPMHIGTALNVPTVAIFGPTTKELGFYPQFSNVSVIENNNISCRPCHIHGPNSCPKKHFQCMRSITDEQVFNFCMSRIL